jgi:hypothetical protein
MWQLYEIGMDWLIITNSPHPLLQIVSLAKALSVFAFDTIVGVVRPELHYEIRHLITDTRDFMGDNEHNDLAALDRALAIVAIAHSLLLLSRVE